MSEPQDEFACHTNVAAGRFWRTWSCGRCGTFLLETVISIDAPIQAVEVLDGSSRLVLQAIRHRCTRLCA